MSDVVLLKVKNNIAYITLNRPKVFNAINNEMPSALADAVERANTDDRVRVIIVRGAGGAFCSGYDLKIYAETKGMACACF